MDKIKVLYVINGFAAADGVSSFVKTYYQNINLNKFQIDFMTIANQPADFENIVRSKNSTIYSLKPIKESIHKFCKDVNHVLDENNYDIVHVHILGPAAYFTLRSAYKHRIKKIIWHSHSSKNGDTLLGAKRNDILAKFSLKYVNTFFACSKEASIALFGDDRAHIINNAIDSRKFKFDVNTRVVIRNELNLEENHVIGIVARLVASKNPIFVVDIAKVLIKNDPKAKFLWIGDGELKEDVEKYIKESGLGDNFVLLGSVDDVYKYYNAFDLFLLPSKFEGLGIVYIEAQTNGLPTIASDAVPEVTRISKLIKYLSLDYDAEKWADCIYENLNVDKNRDLYYSDAAAHNYDIVDEIKKLEECYER